MPKPNSNRRRSKLRKTSPREAIEPEVQNLRSVEHAAAMVKVTFHLDRYETADGALWPPCEFEGLWATPLGEHLYRLENSPFYAKGVNFRDIVYALDNIYGKLIAQNVTERSGHSTFRILLREGVDQEHSSVRDLFADINAAGSFYESTDKVLFAFDVPPSTAVDTINAILEFGVKQQIWDVEFGSDDAP